MHGIACNVHARANIPWGAYSMRSTGGGAPAHTFGTPHVPHTPGPIR